jgi:hypothetical protein
MSTTAVWYMVVENVRYCSVANNYSNWIRTYVVHTDKSFTFEQTAHTWPIHKCPPQITCTLITKPVHLLYALLRPPCKNILVSKPSKQQLNMASMTGCLEQDPSKPETTLRLNKGSQSILNLISTSEAVIFISDSFISYGSFNCSITN